MKRVGLFILVVMVLGGGAWLWLGAKRAEAPTTNPQTSSEDTNTEIPSVSEKLFIGFADAPLTIVEYGDFQCPICKNFFDRVEPSIKQDYIDTGKVKIEFRVETHIGAESAAAGEAAWCANDQGKFPQYHDELYTRQDGTNAGTFSSSNLKDIAADLKLDQAKFDSCLDSGKYKQKVVDSNAEARTKIASTPTFFINNQRIVGAQPYSVFKALIEAQLP